MQVLALDIGDARIGVASGNTDARIANPVKVLPANEVTANARTWRDLLADYEPELIVAGLPKSMSGKNGKQAAHVRKIAEQVAQDAGLPLEFVDERLSSAGAKRILREQGLSERDMRGKVDMVAASLFLQTWFDINADNERGR